MCLDFVFQYFQHFALCVKQKHKTKKMNKLKLLIILTLISCVFCNAQNVGFWNILSIKKEKNKSISFQLDVHTRAQKLIDNFNAYDFRFTTEFKKNEQLSFAATLSNHYNFSDGGNFKSPITSKEIRFSIQAKTKQNFGKLNVANRYRIEQRYFLNTNAFAYRFRYRLELNTPLFKKINIQCNDEIFLTTRNPNSIFDRNILTTGFIIKCSKKYDLQLNYLNQWVHRNDQENLVRTLQIAHTIKF